MKLQLHAFLLAASPSSNGDQNIEEERTRRRELQPGLRSPFLFCWGMPNLFRQPEEAQYLRTISVRLGGASVRCYGVPRSPSLLLLPFPPTPFALHNPLQRSATGVRTKSLQGRAPAPVEFLVAARSIAGAAKYFSLR
jgi:hypothetical protein